VCFIRRILLLTRPGICKSEEGSRHLSAGFPVALPCIRHARSLEAIRSARLVFLIHFSLFCSPLFYFMTYSNMNMRVCQYFFTSFLELFLHKKRAHPLRCACDFEPDFSFDCWMVGVSIISNTRASECGGNHFRPQQSSHLHYTAGNSREM
jgi:hypothetical protein